jgi:hypothetical protein
MKQFFYNGGDGNCQFKFQGQSFDLQPKDYVQAPEIKTITSQERRNFQTWKESKEKNWGLILVDQDFVDRIEKGKAGKKEAVKDEPKDTSGESSNSEPEDFGKSESKEVKKPAPKKKTAKKSTKKAK